MFKFSKFFKQDIVLSFLTILLAFVGVVNVFSTTYSQAKPVSTDFIQQILFIVVGTLIFSVILCFDSNWLKEPKLIALVVTFSLATLVLVLFAGELVYGTRRWLNFGAFSFQPSEFAKLTVILITAFTFISTKRIQLAKLVNLLQPQKADSKKVSITKIIAINFRLLIMIPIVLVTILLVWLQPSLGNSIIIFVMWGLLLSTLIQSPYKLYSAVLILGLGVNAHLRIFNFDNFYSTINFSFIFAGLDLGLVLISILISLFLGKFLNIRVINVIALLFIGLAIGVSANFGWENLFSQYQRDRVTAYINPNADPLGAYWQVNQAKIAIGSGQILGKGFLQGTQSSSGLLPFAYTDFAYAAFTEQFGLVGSLFLLGLLYVIVMRVIYIAQNANDNFGKLICFGVAIMLTLNIVINIGMNLGLMPVTGVPLPLVSYGGSSVLVNLIGLGLVQMIYAETPLKMETTKLGEIN